MGLRTDFQEPGFGRRVKEEKYIQMIGSMDNSGHGEKRVI